MGVLDPPVERVEACFAARLGIGSLRLVDRQLASQGWSDETGLLSFETSDGEPVEFVVRRHRKRGPFRSDVDLRRHFTILQALRATPVPAPEVLWFDAGDEPFGGPYLVMRRAPGTAPVPWTPEGRRFLAEAGSGPPGDQFVEILAAIHEVDLPSVGLDELDPSPAGFGLARRCTEQLDELLTQTEVAPEPVLVDGVEWLRAHLPVTTRVALLHGDYRTGNLLFHGSTVTAVLDWEFARIGDPHFDLGWVCAPSNRMGSDLVCMLMPYDEFIARYERRSQTAVDGDVLRFWMVYHQVRHAVRWMEGAAAFAAGDSIDLRLARAYYTMPTLREMVAGLLEYP